jgi:hypothetical protein
MCVRNSSQGRASERPIRPSIWALANPFLVYGFLSKIWYVSQKNFFWRNAKNIVPTYVRTALLNPIVHKLEQIYP